jgi:hypothetical protein
MATSSDNSAANGGLLVILGIVVALGAVYFFTQYNGRPSTDINISADIPNPVPSNNQ